MQQASWFVVQTNPQRETFVTEQLSHLETYLPLFKSMKGRIVPVFPNYLFVRQIFHWAQINFTVGVRGLLMSGEHPAYIPDSVIRDWRGKERNGLVQLPDPPKFKPGQKLTITRGSLRHRTVIHAGMSGKDRERVLIEMLGQTVVLVVPSEDLVPEVKPNHKNNLRYSRERFIRQSHSASCRAIA